jgi:hypothetical protein
VRIQQHVVTADPPPPVTTPNSDNKWRVSPSSPKFPKMKPNTRAGCRASCKPFTNTLLIPERTTVVRPLHGGSDFFLLYGEVPMRAENSRGGGAGVCSARAQPPAVTGQTLARDRDNPRGQWLKPYKRGSGSSWERGRSDPAADLAGRPAREYSYRRGRSDPAGDVGVQADHKPDRSGGPQRRASASLLLAATPASRPVWPQI